MLKCLCLILLLGLSANVVAQDALDEEIWPRDIFNLVMHDAKPPIRGWTFNSDTVLDYSGTLDYEEFIVTALKPGNDTVYFHVSVKSGIENETEQAVYEVRVKKVKTPHEDWTHNFRWDEGEWSGERGRSIHWLPGQGGEDGVCHWGGISSFPVSKQDCFSRTVWTELER